MTSIFEPLRLIGEDIYLHEPSGNDSSGGPGTLTPALVVLCTWAGGATPRRINKYLAQYRQLYPSSALLLITTSIPDTAFRPFRWIRRRLKPARRAIRQVLASESRDTDDRPGILFHLFSHGGSNIGVQLSLAMREEADHDCSPGDDAFERSYRAALLSVPQNAIAQFVSGTLLYPSLSVLNGLQNAGFIRAVRDLRLALNDPNTFGTEAKRLYIYSKEDVMVGWEDVQSHFEEARSQGYTADQIVFESGSHCTLMVEDADRYWKAVQGFWEGGDLSALTFNPAPSGAISTSRNQPHSRSRL
ncbi:unnamed protein product [Penicillium pancosmium]